MCGPLTGPLRGPTEQIWGQRHSTLAPKAQGGVRNLETVGGYFAVFRSTKLFARMPPLPQVPPIALRERKSAGRSGSIFGVSSQMTSTLIT